MAEYRQNTGYDKLIANSGEWDESKHPRDDDGKFSENGLPSSGKGDNINLTKQEWAQYYKMLGDEQHGDFVYRNGDGSRFVRLPNKIVIDNGDFMDPKVMRVLMFPKEEEIDTMLNILAAKGIIK